MKWDEYSKYKIGKQRTNKLFGLGSALRHLNYVETPLALSSYPTEIINQNLTKYLPIQIGQKKQYKRICSLYPFYLKALSFFISLTKYFISFPEKKKKKRKKSNNETAKGSTTVKLSFQNSCLSTKYIGFFWWKLHKSALSSFTITIELM